MHLPNAVLLSAAIALASELEPLQVHALGNEEADAFVGRFLRSDTTSRARIEERGAFKMPFCLSCLPGMRSPAKLLAAGAAEKAEANAAKLAEANAAKALTPGEETEQALQILLYKLEKAFRKMPETELGIGFFILSPRYDSMLAAVQEVNGKLPEEISISLARVLVRRFGNKEVRSAIIKVIWSISEQIANRGIALAKDYNEEVENGRAILKIVVTW